MHDLFNESIALHSHWHFVADRTSEYKQDASTSMSYLWISQEHGQQGEPNISISQQRDLKEDDEDLEPWQK